MRWQTISDSTPPMLRRWRAWLVGASVMCLIVAAGLLLVTGLPNLPRPGVWKVAAATIALIPSAVLHPVWRWRTRRLCVLARRTHGRLCPCCAYDVSGLDAAGLCPECGTNYNTACDAERWLAFAAKR